MSAQEACLNCAHIIQEHGWKEDDGPGYILNSGKVKGFKFSYRLDDGAKQPITRLTDDGKWVPSDWKRTLGILTAWLHATGKYRKEKKEPTFRKEKKEEPSGELALLKECTRLQRERIAQLEEENARLKKELDTENTLLKELETENVHLKNELEEKNTLLKELKKEVVYLKDGVDFWEKHSKDCDHCKTCTGLHA